jgi:uncharacterized protein with ParB-like and HNH nuclease domain
MISKNFEFLKTSSHFRNYYEELEELENKMWNEDFSFGNKTGQLLEKILLQVGGSTSSANSEIGSLIDMVKSKILYEKNTRIATSVWNALQNIKNYRNADSHAQGEYQFYQNTSAFFIMALNAFHCILSYFANVYYEENLEIDNFHDDVYINRNQDEYSFNDRRVEIQKETVKSFILNKENVFIIPDYQRKYQWNKDQCEDLIDSLIRKSDEEDTVYFGSMAISIDDRSQRSDGNNRIEIRVIDGQQRITTTLILAMVIYDIISNFNAESVDDERREIPPILSDLFATKEKISNIFPDKKTSQMKVLNDMLSFDSTSERWEYLRNVGPENLIYTNYIAMRNRLATLDIDKLLAVCQHFVSNFIFACINFNDIKTSEMEVFDNLNSKGLGLEVRDLIKNHMFNMISNYDDKKQYILHYFDNYLGTNDDDKKFSDFLRKYYLYKTSFSEFEKHKIKLERNQDFLKMFRLLILDQKFTFDKYVELCISLGQYLKIFMDVTSKSNVDDDYIKMLDYKSDKDLSLLYFYVLDVYGQWDFETKKMTIINEEKYLECFKNIERWLTLNNIYQGQGNNFDQTFIRMFKYLNSEKNRQNFSQTEWRNLLPDLIANWSFGFFDSMMVDEALMVGEIYKCPSKKQLMEKIKTSEIKNKGIQMLVLKRIENYLMTKDPNLDRKLIRKKPTIEHIMPKKLGKWYDDIRLDSNYKDRSNQAIDDDYGMYGNRLGNLLILDSEKNTELSNNPFRDKKIQYQKEHNVLAEFEFLYEANKISLYDCENWTFEHINARSSYLAEVLLSGVYGLKD